MVSLRINQQLKRLAKSRLALSTVVTTLIIIVISVLLSSVVTYFAINVTGTRVQEENLALTKQHVWYDSVNQKAEAAIMVINAGGRDITIDRLTVRGQECAWSKVLYFVTSDSISNDLFYNATLVDGGSIHVGGTNRVFKQAANDLPLQSGKTLIIYISNPDSISVNDVGLTVSINVFTSQAMYYKETNVQESGGTSPKSSVSPTAEPTPSAAPTSEKVQIVYASAYSPSTTEGAYQELAMVITNTGSSSEEINYLDFLIGNQRPDLEYIVGNYVESPTSSLPYHDPTKIFADPVQGLLLNSQPSLTLATGESAILYFVLVRTAPTLWTEGQIVTFQLALDNHSYVSNQVTAHIHDI
jgi:hypothetical protein